MKGEHMKKLLSLLVVMLMTFMLFTGAGFASVPEDMDMHKASTSVAEVVKIAISDIIMLEAARLMDFKSVKPGSLEPTFNLIIATTLIEDPGKLTKTYKQPGKFALACSLHGGGQINAHTIRYEAPLWPVIARINGKGVTRYSEFTEPLAHKIV